MKISHGRRVTPTPPISPEERDEIDRDPLTPSFWPDCTCVECYALHRMGKLKATVEELTQKLASATSTVSGCICHGNWRAIVNESRDLIGCEYERNDDRYRYLGPLDGDDDYYYLMERISRPGFMLLSCVGSIEAHGFTRADPRTRTAVKRADELDAARYRHLREIPPIQAQTFFWHFPSRKQRDAAIDASIAQEHGPVVEKRESLKSLRGMAAGAKLVESEWDEADELRREVEQLRERNSKLQAALSAVQISGSGRDLAIMLPEGLAVFVYTGLDESIPKTVTDAWRALVKQEPAPMGVDWTMPVAWKLDRAHFPSDSVHDSALRMANDLATKGCVSVADAMRVLGDPTRGVSFSRCRHGVIEGWCPECIGERP